MTQFARIRALACFASGELYHVTQHTTFLLYLHSLSHTDTLLVKQGVEIMTKRASLPLGMNRHRVVVSGIGVVTPVGIGKDDFWDGLIKGQNGISRITLFDPSEFRSQMAAEVKDFCAEEWIDRKLARRTDRFTHFALIAANLAMKDAGLDTFPFDGRRAGVIIGSGIGGTQALERASADLLAKGPRSVGL